jgi:O-antigen ligase
VTESVGKGEIYLFGAGTVAALMIGGGTMPGLWTDSVLQVAFLVSAIPIILAFHHRKIDLSVVLFLTFLVLIAFVQLLPLPRSLVELVRPAIFELPAGMENQYLFASLSLGRTIDSAIYIAVLVVVSVCMFLLPRQHLYFLGYFLAAGFAFNVILSLIQYSASFSVKLSPDEAYDMAAGAFANRNHLAALIYMSIPFFVYFYIDDKYRVWSGLALAISLLVLLATGSRAGAILAVIAVLASYIVLSSRRHNTFRAVAGMAGILFFLGMGLWGLQDSSYGLLQDRMRPEIAATTLSAIEENWALGTGYGTFPTVYQAYESASSIGVQYINRAHNDYLEVALEGGILGAMAIAVYIIVIGAKLIRGNLNSKQKAAALGISFILLHSLVDYPLRTMAIGVVFIYFNAMLFHRRGRARA